MNAQPSRPQPVRGEAHARELVTAWRGANVPLKVFCRERNVSYPSLYAWKRRLDQLVPALLEVKIAPAPTRASYEVLVAGGRAVRVTDDFDDATLLRLVAVLERAC